MHSTRNPVSRSERRGGLMTPRRNRFFHGKRMDVYHFEMETEYGIAMRRLLNRLVTGGGVVCGLDVVSGHDPCTIGVTAGVAIDGWGREIIVPAETRPIPLPPALIDRVCGRPPDGNGNGHNGNGNGKPGYEEPVRQTADSSADGDGADTPEQRGNGKNGYDRPDHDEPKRGCVTVVLCYQECESDPVAVLAGDCGNAEPCAAGAIEERYRISFEPGCADPIDTSCRFPDILTSGEIDYGALAKWVTRGCPDPPRNPCIPLANLHLDCRDDHCDINDIDITIRPIVIGNGLVLDLLSRIVEEEQSGESWRR